MDYVVNKPSDVEMFLPKNMKLPIPGFKDPRYHLMATTDHLDKVVQADGMILPISLLATLLDFKEGFETLLEPSHLTEHKDFIRTMIKGLWLSKFVATYLAPRMNFIRSTHFFGMQFVRQFRGLTELKDDKISNLTSEMHWVLSPFEFIIFNQPVHASADGEVVEVINDYEDKPNTPTNLNFGAIKVEDFLGNRIRIRSSRLCNIVYGNLKKNSIAVRVGDKVKTGDVIARVGVSGQFPSPFLYFAMELIGPAAPIAGNMRISIPQRMWTTYFKCPLLNKGFLANHRPIDEDFYRYFRGDNVKYEHALGPFDDCCFVKQYPSILTE